MLQNKRVIYFFLVLSILLSNCTNSTIIFSDNFEDDSLNEWNKSGAGKVYLDTSKSYSGKQSICFESGEGFKNRAFIALENETITSLERFYGSMYMFVQEASPDGVHWTMIQASGKTPNGFHSEIRYGGQHQKRIMANYDTNPIKTDCWHHTQFKIPEKKWFSVQWFFDRKSNNAKLWIDGELVHELNANDVDKGCLANDNNQNWTFPLFEQLTLGWVDYQKGGCSRKIWIDDVILSKEKLD
ncbi:conserved exported hypothetical protein [Tenacibaculum sp. 190524A05c]|uniref:hypothetical protein n=1 Tax=Tenacibaculum platacis TaxID=3137852 RepID=UPI0031FB916B